MYLYFSTAFPDVEVANASTDVPTSTPIRHVQEQDPEVLNPLIDPSNGPQPIICERTSQNSL